MPDFSYQNPDDDEPGISVELLNLYDEFAELHNSCSFLFEATTCMLKSNTEIDRVAIEGLSSLSWQMRHKAKELKEELTRLHKKSRQLETIYRKIH